MIFGDDPPVIGNVYRRNALRSVGVLAAAGGLIISPGVASATSIGLGPRPILDGKAIPGTRRGDHRRRPRPAPRACCRART